MNAQELANVLQRVKADLVLQETLRVTKQDWIKLNLTTQETFWGINTWSENVNEISDWELESSNSWTKQYTDCGGTCGAISRACCG
ncbi:MAG: hypothetical protein GPI90_11710 [Microcystis aeruginosa K13-05]|jgi:hypothetical protein|uniref:hypothetical protein n=1 Tax=unclassified Microcystis TaxID=2643300 RepID=UPI0022C769F8|nr:MULTISPECIES: hypothetical protein [unclassified Microcystis]MCZ8046635.1 hypothetical protein [Microcystis sp. LE19-41.2A]MCZ8290751.1 hypothetical protein [Microcystis sp. LE19-59.1C]NCR80715.1 hypothetical protein [Microcystis aeruginosa K13-10]NCR85278.1 hypothetical protein [Microcystis aeruginosa K13-05]